MWRSGCCCVCVSCCINVAKACSQSVLLSSLYFVVACAWPAAAAAWVSGAVQMLSSDGWLPRLCRWRGSASLTALSAEDAGLGLQCERCGVIFVSCLAPGTWILFCLLVGHFFFKYTCLICSHCPLNTGALTPSRTVTVSLLDCGCGLHFLQEATEAQLLWEAPQSRVYSCIFHYQPESQFFILESS